MATEELHVLGGRSNVGSFGGGRGYRPLTLKGKPQCQGTAATRDRWTRYYQCPHTGSLLEPVPKDSGRIGVMAIGDTPGARYYWCRQHAPSLVRERKEIRDAKWVMESHRQKEKWDRDRERSKAMARMLAAMEDEDYEVAALAFEDWKRWGGVVSR